MTPPRIVQTKALRAIATRWRGTCTTIDAKAHLILEIEFFRGELYGI
jgi:hypothetical protein